MQVLGEAVLLGLLIGGVALVVVETVRYIIAGRWFPR